MRWLESEEGMQTKRKIAENNNFKEEDIEWFSRDGKKWMITSYRRHRRTLKYIVEQLAMDNKKSMDDVYDLFFRAHFTGNILEIAHLIDSSFGDGSFRVVGMMTDDYKSASQMLDYLKKQRIRIKNKDEENKDKTI